MSCHFVGAALGLALLLRLTWPLAAQPFRCHSNTVPLWLDDTDPEVEFVWWPARWWPLGWPLLL